MIKKEIKKKVKKHRFKPKEELFRKDSPFKKDLIKLIILVFVIFLASAVLWKPISGFIKDTSREELKQNIAGFGILGPIVYVCVVIAQTIISLIPGQPLMIFGGYAFGALWGTILTTIGLVIGAGFAFYLGRRYGRPFLEDWLSKESLEKFDKKPEKRMIVVFLFIFLLPFTPDNAACLAAGLTRVRLKNLLWIVALGRLPGTVITSMIGAGIGDEFTIKLWIGIGIIAALLALGYYFKDKLEEHAQRVLGEK